jgi:hypothetical protein
MSDFMRGHGRVPFKPMPRRGFVAGGREMGVVATMRVNVIVLLLGLIESAFAFAFTSEGGGRDIYSFSWMRAAWEMI